MRIGKLTEEEVKFAKEHYVKGNSHFGVMALAKMFNVNYRTIFSAINNNNVVYISNSVINSITKKYKKWSHSNGANALSKEYGIGCDLIKSIVKNIGD